MKAWSQLLIAFLLAVPAGIAAAQGIVLESYEGPRPSEANDWLQPVYRTLHERGFVSGASLTSSIDEKLFREDGVLTAGNLMRAQSRVDQGYQLLIEGDYHGAIVASTQALQLYATSRSLLSREIAVRDLQFKAMLILARSHEALEDAENAFRVAAEIHRTFPERQVNTQQFDPRVKDLHRRVRDELMRQGVGTLELHVDDPTAAVFLNERFVGSGSVTLSPLFPGEYRVFVAKGPQTGRIHTIIVNAGETTTHSIPWETERLLRTSGGIPRLELADGEPPARELDIATRVGRALGSDAVVILSIRTVSGRRSVVGHAVRVDSQRRIYGAVQMEPLPAAARLLERLGAFLGGDSDVDTSQILLQEPLPLAVPPAPQRPRWYADAWGWGLAGSGAVILGGAGALLWDADRLFDDSDVESRQSRRHDLRNRGEKRVVASGVAGAFGMGLLAAGIIKLVYDGEVPRPAERLRLFATANGVSVIGWF